MHKAYLIAAALAPADRPAAGNVERRLIGEFTYRLIKRMGRSQLFAPVTADE
jgi:hypothetical protein